MKHVRITPMLLVLALWLGLPWVMPSPIVSAQPTQTFADVIGDTPQFSILEEALERTGVNITLAQGGPYTVFAPTNAAFRRAFDKLGIRGIDDLPQEQLTGLLLYHVVEGKILSSELEARQTIPTLATPTLDVIKREDRIVVRASFSRARVVRPDIETISGVIHAVNNVLLSIPVPEPPRQETITTTLSNDPQFSTLTELLQQTGLDDDLAQEGPFTLFAPTNAAFAELFAVLDSQQISLSPEQLTGLLLYHVVEGEILAADLAPQQTVPTLASPTLDIRQRDGEITVEASFSTARVTEKDILASNGVIHAIDAVLVSIPGIVPEEPEAPEPSIDVFPNAFVDELNIDLQGFSPTTVKVEIFSLEDNRVAFTQEVATSGMEVITLDVSALESQARPYVLLLTSSEFANIFLIQKE